MRRITIALAAAALLLTAGERAFAAGCSQPASEGPQPVVRDCIYVARASIGLTDCVDCLCDVDGSGGVQMNDALACLRYVVGNEVELGCPDCLASTTTSTTIAVCASCNDVLTESRDYEDLCPLSRMIYDEMKACPNRCVHPCVCGAQIPELPPCEPQPMWTCLQCFRTQCAELTQNCREN